MQVCSPRSLVSDQIFQVKLKWAKVIYQNKVKRISKPSADFGTFINQIKGRFRDLEDFEYAYDNADDHDHPFKTK